MALRRTVKVVFCLAAVTLMVLLTGLTGPTPTDFQKELAEIEHILWNESRQPEIKQNDPDFLLKNVHYVFLKSSLTGRPEDIEKAGAAFNKARSAMNSAELDLLHASFNLKLHRLEDAKSDLGRLSFMDDDTKVQVLKADIAVQEGDYKTAAASYQAIIEKSRTWDHLSRIAYLHAKFGDSGEADQLYREAEEHISSKEMRSYAWVELQRGYLALSRGQYETAWDHYQRADQAYSGYWLIQEYMAEWLGAQRKFDAAAELYQRILNCVQRPELYHALGDLYVSMGRPELARPWHDRALALYLDSALRGEVHYYHHLASLYADSRLDGAQAVKWARLDIQLRQNVSTRDALAWALFRDGQYTAAADEMKKALSGNWQDAHLFFHAAMIFLAAGLPEEGKDYLQKAARINPYYDAFHVHR